MHWFELTSRMHMWRGKRVMVVDVHGYPVKTVDLRWVTVVDPKRRYLDVIHSKRNVPVEELE